MYRPADRRETSMKAGAINFLIKPFDERPVLAPFAVIRASGNSMSARLATANIPAHLFGASDSLLGSEQRKRVGWLNEPEYQ